MVYQWNAKSLQLVPIVPSAPMDDQSPTVLNLIGSGNSLSPLNHVMRCISPMVCQWTDRSHHWYDWYQWHQSDLATVLILGNEMHFTNGIRTDCQSIPLDSVCVYWTTLNEGAMRVLIAVPCTCKLCSLLKEKLFIVRIILTRSHMLSTGSDLS